MGVTGKPAHGPLLAKETVEIVRVKICTQHLDRNEAVQHRLGAAVDDPESAASDLLDVAETLLPQFREDVRDQVPVPRKWIAVGHRSHDIAELAAV